MKYKNLKFVVSSSTFCAFLFTAMPALAQRLQATPLDLETAMNMAENHSYSARMAQSNEDVARGKKNEQLLGMLPNVSASGNYLKYDDKVNKATGTLVGALSGVPGPTVSSAGFTLTQPIVGLVPMFIGLQQACAATQAALHTKEQTKAESRFLGASSYINAIKALKLVDVSNSGVQVAKTQLQDGQAQFNAGKLTNADILKFKLNLENAKTILIQAQTTYKVALLTLAEAIGVPSPEQIALPPHYTPTWGGKRSDLKDIPTYINQALVKRSDLNSFKANVEAAKYQKYATVSSYLPTVNFVSSYTRNLQATDASNPLVPAGTPGSSYSKNDIQDTWFYGVQLNWNILDWGVRQMQIGESVAREHSAQLQNEQSQSQVKIEVTNNFLSLQDAYQMFDSATVSADYAKDVFSQMEAQFNNGQTTTTDVLSSSNDKMSAEAKLANAVGDLDIAWLNLQKSVGERLTTLTK